MYGNIITRAYDKQDEHFPTNIPALLHLPSLSRGCRLCLLKWAQLYYWLLWWCGAIAKLHFLFLNIHKELCNINILDGLQEHLNTGSSLRSVLLKSLSLF